MGKFLKVLGAVALLLLGLYFTAMAVIRAIFMRDFMAIVFLIPGGALIAVAIAVFQWARE